MSFSKATDAVINLTNKVFRTTVVYTYLAGGPTSTINGVFDNAFVVVNGVSTKKPVLRIKLSDLNAEPVEDDTVTIGSDTYSVKDHEPDSHGATTLILEKT